MGMTGVVVCSDEVDVDGFGDSRHLVEILDATPTGSDNQPVAICCI